MKNLTLIRNLMILLFVMMIFGLTLPFSVLAAIIAITGITVILLDKNVISFNSVVEARMLRLKTSRKNLIMFAVITILPVFLALTIAPSLSSEDDLPNVSVLKPFSAQCRYMSREGFLMYIARRDYGLILSRREARKIIRKQRKYGAPAYVRNIPQYDNSRFIARVKRVKRKKRKIRRVYDRASIIVRSRFSHRRGLVSRRRSRRLRDIPVTRFRKNRKSYYDYYKPVSIDNNEYVVKTKIKRKPVYVAERKKFRARISKPRYSSHTSYRSFRYSKNRVVVLPFMNSGVSEDPAGRVEASISNELRNKGYEIVSIPHDIYYEAEHGHLSKSELKSIAERLGVEYIVTGDVQKYRSYKKLRIAGLILGGLISGVHCYGDVQLDGMVYSLSSNRIIRHNVKNRSKKQVLGLVAGTGDLLGLSLNRAVSKMLAFM